MFGSQKKIKQAQKAVEEERQRLERKLKEQERQMKVIEEERKKKEQELLMMQKRQQEEVAQAQALWDEESLRRQGEIMGRAEMNVLPMGLTKSPIDLEEHLNAHRAGTLMKQVVISNQPPPDRELHMTRLRKFKPQNDFSKLLLSDIVPFNLMDEYTELNLAMVVDQKTRQSMKPYCLVSDVFIHYIPLDTFHTRSFPVEVSINDFRKLEDNTMRYFKFSHTAGYNILMTLDYCIQTKDLEYLTLAISTKLNSFKKDLAWGTVKVIVSLIHFDFPVKTNLQETRGVMHLSDSDLIDHLSDPRGADGILSAEAMRLLREGYVRGEVENVLLAQDNEKDINPDPTALLRAQPEQNAAELLRGLRDMSKGMKSSDTLVPDSTSERPSNVIKKNPFQVGKDLIEEDEKEKEARENMQRNIDAVFANEKSDKMNKKIDEMLDDTVLPGQSSSQRGGISSDDDASISDYGNKKQKKKPRFVDYGI